MPDAPGMATDRQTVRLTTWSVIRAVLAVGVAALVVSLARAAETPLWWVAIAAVIGALLSPLTLWLSRYVPRGVAIALVLVFAGAFSVFVVYRGLSEVSAQVESLRTEATTVVSQVERSETYGQVATEFDLADKVADFFDSLPAFVGGGDAASAVDAVTSNAGGLAAVFFLLVLLIVSGDRMVRAGVAQLLDEPVRTRVLDLLRAAYGRVSVYLGLVGGRALAVGMVVGVVSSLAGVPAATVVALWFALWSIVPGVGLVVAAVPFCAGLAVSSPIMAAALAVGVLVVQYASAVTVDRWIATRSVAVGAVLTLIAVAVGIELYGFGGALVSLYLVSFTIAAGHELGAYGANVSEAVRNLGREPSR